MSRSKKAGFISFQTVVGLFAGLALTACSSTPLSYNELRITSPLSAYTREVPGIVPTMVSREKKSLVVFGIHGMGRTDFCNMSDVAQMFLDGDPNAEIMPSTQNFDVPCENVPTRIMPVCLDQNYTVRSEAFLGGDLVKIGSECDLGSAFDFEQLTRDDYGEDKRPRSISRFGTLVHYKITRTFDAVQDKPVEIDYFGYWWQGDGNAVQAPFVHKDLSDDYKNERTYIAQLIKRQVLNEGLSDAALINGSMRQIMLVGAGGALCQMANVLNAEELSFGQAVTNPCARVDTAKIGEVFKERQLIMLSQSLGSRILFDALDGFQWEQVEKVNGIADAILDADPILYMSANQLPLLAISTVRVEPAGSGAEPTPVFAAASTGSGANFFSRLLSDEGRQREPVVFPSNADGLVQSETTDARIVAFYDPNDALGYRAGDHLPKASRERIVEVTQRYAVPLFLWVNPVEAHDQSFTKNKGKLIVMCGAERVSVESERLRANADCRQP